MSLKSLFIMLLITGPCVAVSQHIKTPRNLKSAIRELDKHTSDSIKNLILKSPYETIDKLSYPRGKSNFKTVFNWTRRDNFGSRISKYLDKRGVSKHQTEVILIAFKDYLTNKYFNEKAILRPYQKLETEWREEDEVRYSTDSLRGNYIPKDLQDCFSTLNRLLPDSSKSLIRSQTENEFVSKQYRFGLGLWMRNNWALWSGSRLSKFFTTNGIEHPESISVVIMESYHRYLNEKDIGFEKQIVGYRESAEKYEAEKIKDEENERFEQVEILQEFEIGDTLVFSYRYDFVSSEQENKWRKGICRAKGVLIGKDDTLLTIQINVFETCDKKGIIIYNNDNIHILDPKTKKWIRPKKRIVRYLRKGRSAWFDLGDWFHEHIKK